MNNTDQTKKFNAIVSRIFRLPEDSIRDDMTSKDVPDWDSMNYLLFIAELEKEFHFSFTMDEVVGASVLGDLRNIVNAREASTQNP